MAVILVRIKDTAFGAGKVFENYASMKRKVQLVVGSDIDVRYMVPGKLLGSVNGYNNYIRNSSVIINITGYYIPDEVFFNTLGPEFRNPIADLVQRDIVEVLKGAVPATYENILKGTV